MMLKLALGLAVLLLLRALHIAKDKAKAHIVLAFATATVLAVVGLNAWVSHQRLVPETSTTRLVSQGVATLRSHLADPAIDLIIVVDGGSYPTRGLNGDRFGQVLSDRLGRPVGIVQMTQGGANHFERHHTFRMLLAELDDAEREALRGRDVHLMLEVQRGYDLNPMAQFNSNKFTDRTYGYLTPANAAVAISTRMRFASWKTRRERVPESFEILSHALVNAFGVGGIDRLRAIPDLEPLSGYVPLSRAAPGFEFPGLEPVRARLASDARTAKADWIDEVRVPRITALFGDLADRVTYFAVPTTYGEYAAYASRFCRDHDDALCIDFNHPRLLQLLDDAGLWADKGHLRRRGAFIYSTWLAGRYADALQKESAP